MYNVNNKNSLLNRSQLNPIQFRLIGNTWAPYFRTLVLNNLPMDKIRDLFCPDNGRPTKELRAVVGALILQHWFNLTYAQAAERYTYDLLWAEALNLASLKMSDRSVTARTLYSYSKLLTEHGLLEEMFNSVTRHLIAVTDTRIDIQRLDSVHIRSNMAKLSRLQLLTKTTVKFLKNLKKNHREEYNSIDAALLKRYLSDDESDPGSSYNHFFSQARPGETHNTLLSVATDIFALLEAFRANDAIAAMASYKLLQRIFSEQCSVAAPENAECPNGPVKIEIKEPKQISGGSLQNPSDPTAAYSGHKGEGYHAQLMETCCQPDGTGANLITYVHVEPANRHDGNAPVEAIEATDKAGFKPKKMLCDTSYGSDENVERAKELGVDLISPAGGKDPEAGKVRLAEFNFDEDGNVTSCPEGQKPWVAHETKGGRRVCGFDHGICAGCPKANFCPAVGPNGKAQLTYTPKDLRLSGRRAREQTDEFKGIYRQRSGIEATNSEADRVSKLKNSRARGIERVQHGVFLKVIALNFRRARAALCRKNALKAA
jgi:hypothetical protein